VSGARSRRRQSAAKLTYGAVARALGFTELPPRDPKADAKKPGLEVAAECSRILRAKLSCPDSWTVCLRCLLSTRLLLKLHLEFHWAQVPEGRVSASPVVEDLDELARSMCALIASPTTRRENRSRMAARYSQPSAVHT
jgi:hypothetical protein